MAEAHESDRRKYPRIATEQVISVAPISDHARLAYGKNLSPGGICFEMVGCEVDLDETLRVTFNVGDETLVAVGRVMWATELDAFTQEVGLEFIEIDPLALRSIREDLTN